MISVVNTASLLITTLTEGKIKWFDVRNMTKHYSIAAHTQTKVAHVWEDNTNNNVDTVAENVHNIKVVNSINESMSLT